MPVLNTLYGYCVQGNRNVVVHNHIDGNVSGPGFNNGAGNIIAPISNGTNPAPNDGFP